MIFDSDRIWEIQGKAIEWDLHEKRDMLLFGINRTFVAELPQADNSAAQVLSDLNAMSEAGTIVGKQVPLERWLRNAANATTVYPDRHSYFLGLADEAKARAAAIESAKSAGGLPKPPGGPRIQSFGDLPGGVVVEREDQSDLPRVPNPDAGGRTVTSTDTQAFQLADAALILSPLLILACAGTLAVTTIKAWEVLSAIAALLAGWSLFRLWRPATIIAPAADAAIINARHGTLQVEIRILILSIAASGLLLRFN